MFRRNYLNEKAVGVVMLLALSSFGVAQDTTDSNEKCSKHQYTLASLEGNYAIAGFYGPHAAGQVGTTQIDGKGVITSSTSIVVDPALSAPLELSPITGQVTINPDGTGVFTLKVTFVNGQPDVSFHIIFVVTEAHVKGNELIATRMVGLQQESSGLPGAAFASVTLTKRPD